MSFHIHCPFCQTRIRAPESAIGKKVKCPLCQQSFLIAPEPPPAPPPATRQEETPPVSGFLFSDIDDANVQASPINQDQQPARRGPSTWREYLFFRRMVAPILIQVLFWIGAVT